MKFAVFALSALVATVAAQNSLGQCLQGCSDRMMSSTKAEELSCSQGDHKCLCRKPGFIYGFRDCAAQACTKDDGKQLVDMAVKICSGAGVAIATAGGQSASGGSASSTGASSSGGGGQATVSTIYSTFTSDGTVRSTPIATQTVGGDDGDDGDDDASSSAGGSGGAVVTTITSNGSQIVSTITSALSPGSSSGSATATGSASATQSETASSGGGSTSGGSGGSGASQTGTSGSGSGSASSSSSAGFAAPKVTAAPAAGFLAAAGIAALLI